MHTMPDEDLSQLKIDKSQAAFRPSRRRRPFYALLFLLLAGAGAFLYLNGFITPATPVEVAVVSQVYPSQNLSLLNASGYVVAQRKAAVASKITGRLIALMVEEGSHVQEGQVIARLESEDAAAARDQAEANLKVLHFNLEQTKAELNEATLAFRRSKQLFAEQLVSQADYDVADARYRRAQATVAAAEASIKAGQAALQSTKVTLDYAQIRAPFEAVVLTKDADVGDIVTPLGAATNAKAAVVTIADLRSLEVEADVSETNLGLVKVEQPCEIRLDALPDARFRGMVHAIVPTVDRSKATILVKVRFLEKDPRILPEMSAKVSFLSRPLTPEDRKPILAVNRSALFNRDGVNLLFLIQGEQLVETPVRLGVQLGDLVEIRGAVKPGEKVVIRPSSRLKAGSKIKVVQP
jgi:RND family efflux transporter MFP subunit